METTGPEIWEQTKGQVSAVTFSTGTGGTLAGIFILYSCDMTFKCLIFCVHSSLTKFQWFAIHSG